MILIGIIALLGILDRTARLTGLAGTLAIAGFLLLFISIMRGSGSITDIKAGMWLLLAGGVALIVAVTRALQRERGGG